MNLLFVEDDKTFFEFLRVGLPSHDCVQAESLKRAEDALENRVFDAIFVDLNMPDANQEHILSQVKAMADGTPVIILTGITCRADILKIADQLLFKDQVVPDPSTVIPAAVERAQQIVRAGPVENIVKIWHALGAIRNSKKLLI